MCSTDSSPTHENAPRHTTTQYTTSDTTTTTATHAFFFTYAGGSCVSWTTGMRSFNATILPKFGPFCKEDKGTISITDGGCTLSLVGAPFSFSLFSVCVCACATFFFVQLNFPRQLDVDVMSISLLRQHSNVLVLDGTEI